MIKLSLQARSYAAAILILLFFIPLTVVTLERAYTQSLSQSMLEQLRVQSLTLIAEFELSAGKIDMPEQLFNDKLNIPNSGLYAFIKVDDSLVWRSLSTINWQVEPPLIAPVVGQERFVTDLNLTSDYFLYAYTAEFESLEGFQPVAFFIIQDKNLFDKERKTFANALWYWLGLIALVLLVLIIVSMNMTLRPINTLIEQIKLAEQGEINRLNKAYPPELERLKSSINHLLDAEQQQRSRYKNSLSDLAHSLKTPLAVLQGNPSIPSSATEPLNQINQIIQRQLKRAVAGTGSGWEQAEPILPVVEKLRSAMEKVYLDKHLEFQLELSAEHRFKGDKTDLMEILGNLMDNACKAAKSRVRVGVMQTDSYLSIGVEDDGKGIAKPHRQALLQRGTRLDSYQEGQGIGLAVVSDLVSAYHGTIDISESEFGGALIVIRFPVNDDKQNQFTKPL